MSLGEPEAPGLGGPLWRPPEALLLAFSSRAATAKGEELIKVLKEALFHPEMFVYGELLALDSVAELEAHYGIRGPQEGGPQEGGPCRGPDEGRETLLLLRLLASGTVGDLVELVGQGEATPVAPIILYKLRLLSIVSLAAVSSRLAFTDLQRHLKAPGCCGSPGAHAEETARPEGPLANPQVCEAAAAAAAATAKAELNVREVEDLVLECLRLGLVRGRVDGEFECVDTWGAIGRDPTEGDILAMVSVLEAFEARAGDTLRLLTNAAAALQQQAV